MSARFLVVLIPTLLLGACYTAHDVALEPLEEGDAATNDAATEDAGTDATTNDCIASTCPPTPLGAGCCTEQGTCGIDATAFNFGCIDANDLGGLFGGGAAGAGGGLPPGFFGGGAAGSGGGLPPGFFGGGAAGTGGTPD